MSQYIKNKSFLKLSERIGKNIFLVQGAGGNTSIKEGNLIWVKCSGTWLADSAKKKIFLKINMNHKSDINDKHKIKRPSIETSLHLMMPQKVVIHVHSINAIALSVQQNAKSKISRILKGFKWLWIPYVKPGPDLAKKIEILRKGKKYNIIFLANHGLIVAEESCKKAEDLLKKIESKINIKKLSKTTKPKVPNTFFSENYRLIKYSSCNLMAYDKKIRLLSKGSLYPDHVVFLGPGFTLIKKDQKKEMEKILKQNKLKFFIVESFGVVVKKNIRENEEVMIKALSLVCDRIKLKNKVNFLSKRNECELLSWDQEKYRQDLIR